MKLIGALVAALMVATFIGCDDDVQQPPTQFQCPDGKVPAKVLPQQRYITIVCQDGTVHTQTVTDYNSTYGSQYTSGQDMLADTFMWMWLFGPHYSSYPYYSSYMSSPYYRSYRPSTYVVSNRTIIHNYGSPSRAYQARTIQVQSYTISRASSGYSNTYSGNGKSYSTYSRSSSYGGGYSSGSSYRSSSFGGRR